MAASARRLDRTSAMEQAIKDLATVAPDSDWRLNALVSAGDSYLIDNRVSDYMPHYSACAESFPSNPRAPYCHWKVVWAAWLSRSPSAVKLLQDHLRYFPASDKAGAALYWLAQAARSSGDIAAARSYLTELNAHFPNYFYSVLARETLARPDMRNGAASAAAQAFLASLKLPERDRSPDFSISSSARVGSNAPPPPPGWSRILGRD
jgi:hypothetical protein